MEDNGATQTLSTNAEEPKNDNIELEKFKRRLIRAVARMLLQEKRNEDEVWAGLKKETGCDCKELWNRMHALTIRKLNRLLEAQDRIDLLPKAARMSATDWLLFDTVIVHEPCDVIGMTETTSVDRPVLVELFHIVEKFQIEFLAGDQLADAWTAATNFYNKDNRLCSPMLLQRRWYQLKLSTRARFYKFWSMYKGIMKRLQAVNMYRPTQLQTEIALRYKPLVIKPFMLWEELVRHKLVILPEDFERKDVDNTRKEDENVPDVLCLEPNLETIELDNSDTELEYRKPSTVELPAVTIKEEPKDVEEIVENVPYVNRQEKITHFAEAVLEATAMELNEIDLDQETMLVVQDDDIISVNENDNEDSEISVIQDKATVVSTEPINLEEDNITPVIDVDKQSVEDSKVLPTDDVEIVEEKCPDKEPETVLPQITSIFGGIDVSNEILTKIGMLTAQITNSGKSGIIDKPHQPQNDEPINISSDDGIPIDDDDDDKIPRTEDVPQAGSDRNSTIRMKIDLKAEVSRSSWFGELSNDIDFIDEGLHFVDDGIEYHEEECTYETDKTNQEEELPITKQAEDAPKVDKKLLMIPHVVTVKLDDMGILPLQLLNRVTNKVILDMMTMKSKIQVKKDDLDSDSCDDEPILNLRKVKLSSNLLQKPRNRSYHPIQLCKNPDFNTRLKRLNVGFFGSPRNCYLLKACKPLTIDVSKAFESKLVDGTMYLQSTVDNSFNKAQLPDPNTQSSSVVPTAMPVQSLIDNNKSDFNSIVYPQVIATPNEPIKNKIDPKIIYYPPVIPTPIETVKNDSPNIYSPIIPTPIETIKNDINPVHSPVIPISTETIELDMKPTVYPPVIPTPTETDVNLIKQSSAIPIPTEKNQIDIKPNNEYPLCPLVSNASPIETLKCVTSPVDSTIVTPAEPILQITERSKTINLPDISEIRRINQKLLTAEVTPLQLKNGNSHVPVSIVKDIPANTETLNTKATDKRMAGPASKTKSLQMASKAVSKSAKTASTQSQATNKKFFNLTKHSWRPREARPEVPWISNSCFYYSPDTLLALDTLNKMLCLLTDGSSQGNQVSKPASRQKKSKTGKNSAPKSGDSPLPKTDDPPLSKADDPPPSNPDDPPPSNPEDPPPSNPEDPPPSNLENPPPPKSDIFPPTKHDDLPTPNPDDPLPRELDESPPLEIDDDPPSPMPEPEDPPLQEDVNNDVQADNETNKPAEKPNKQPCVRVRVTHKPKNIYCCWSREKICQLIFLKKNLSRHCCPYPLCECCCREALKEYQRRLGEKSDKNRKSMSTQLDLDNSEVSSHRQGIDAEVAVIIPVVQDYPEAATLNSLHIEENKEQASAVSSITDDEDNVCSDESTLGELVVVSTETDAPDKVSTRKSISTQVNFDDELSTTNEADDRAEVSIIRADTSGHASKDSAVKKACPILRSLMGPPPPPPPKKALFRLLPKVDTLPNTVTSEPSTAVKPISIVIIDPKNPYQLENTRLSSEEANPHSNMFKNINIQYSKKTLYHFPLKPKFDQKKPKMAPKTYGNQKMIYLNSKQISERPTDNPIYLGKNKILLTTARFPVNFKAFEAFQRNINQTMAFPKGIQLILQPNGRITYTWDPNTIANPEFMATLPHLIEALQRQIDSSVATALQIASETNNEVINLVDDETPSKDPKKIKNTENTVITESASQEMEVVPQKQVDKLDMQVGQNICVSENILTGEQNVQLSENNTIIHNGNGTTSDKDEDDLQISENVIQGDLVTSESLTAEKQDVQVSEDTQNKPEILPEEGKYMEICENETRPERHIHAAENATEATVNTLQLDENIVTPENITVGVQNIPENVREVEQISVTPENVTEFENNNITPVFVTSLDQSSVIPENERKAEKNNVTPEIIMEVEQCNVIPENVPEAKKYNITLENITEAEKNNVTPENLMEGAQNMQTSEKETIVEHNITENTAVSIAEPTEMISTTEITLEHPQTGDPATTTKENENVPKTKNILSDLMAMSGIVPVDVTLPEESVTWKTSEQSILNILPKAPVLERIDNAPSEMGPTSPNKKPQQSQSGSNDILPQALTAITSLSELKYACAQKGLFFKLDVDTGLLVPINVCMKKFEAQTSRIANSMIRPHRQVAPFRFDSHKHREEAKSVIDLTEDDAPESTETNEPATNQSTNNQPASNQPDDDQQANIQPDDNQTAIVPPATNLPATNTSLTKRLAINQLVTKRPAASHLATKRSATNQLATKRPATSQLATKRPATNQLATKRPPATSQPATKRLANIRPALKRPATIQPATNRPATDQATTNQLMVLNSQLLSNGPRTNAYIGPLRVLSSPTRDGGVTNNLVNKPISPKKPISLLKTSRPNILERKLKEIQQRISDAMKSKDMVRRQLKRKQEFTNLKTELQSNRFLDPKFGQLSMESSSESSSDEEPLSIVAKKMRIREKNVLIQNIDEKCKNKDTPKEITDTVSENTDGTPKSGEVSTDDDTTSIDEVDLSMDDDDDAGSIECLELQPLEESEEDCILGV